MLTDAHSTVMSYCCDRSRSITWGIEGGLPSIPHGVWLNQGTEDERFLGSIFSSVPIQPGDVFTRPSAGGGGFGDPLERTPEEVLEDIIDGYVSIDRAAADYGVVIEEVDAELDDYRILAGCHPPPRRDPALGHRRTAGELHHPVPPADAAPLGRPLGRLASAESATLHHPLHHEVQPGRCGEDPTKIIPRTASNTRRHSRHTVRHASPGHPARTFLVPRGPGSSSLHHPHQAQAIPAHSLRDVMARAIFKGEVPCQQTRPPICPRWSSPPGRR